MTDDFIAGVAPDTLSLKINDGQMLYEEEYEPGSDVDSERVAEFTKGIVDSYADYLEAEGYDGVDVWTRVTEDDGSVGVTVEIEYHGADVPDEVPYSIAATEMMGLLGIDSAEMWYTVASATSPRGFEVVKK